MASESRPPFPPFTEETATKKVKAAQDAWNSKCVLQYPFVACGPAPGPAARLVEVELTASNAGTPPR